jgi:hypothetical protein
MQKSKTPPWTKKPKKRGRKPGVKVGPYKKRSLEVNAARDMVRDALNLYSPAPILTLCGQLEDTIQLLENRISNAIAKINSLM